MRANDRLMEWVVAGVLGILGFAAVAQSAEMTLEQAQQIHKDIEAARQAITDARFWPFAHAGHRVPYLRGYGRS